MGSVSHPKILLYYAFAPVSDPEAVRLWQRELCESLGLRGRIIISEHGINGTVGGEIDACKQYLKRTREYGPFSGLDVKWSEGTGFDAVAPTTLKGVDRSVPWQAISDFPKLSVKVRDELVAFGIPEETVVDETGVVGGGTHLSPEKVNELVAERGDDVVFFDGRNAWEADIGRFKGAVVPDVKTTHDFIAQIESGAFDDIKGKPIVTYCTGGIRCEILSAAMVARGFEEVYQIDGGIVRYGEAFGNDGLWEGSLAVFDGREAMDFAPGASVIGRCTVCSTATSHLVDCAENSCRTRFVACASHDAPRCDAHALTTA
ncbi:rhodanese-related sulfurtransferase [Leucobacter sp. G161]|uniref:tRNA uridine(34) hydroxylase n=1 Tax=Leucobacter sp. G161 TaxID=663704 RepID=UPI000B2216CF